MSKYTITRVNGELNWDTIPVLPIACKPWMDTDITAQVQLCYDDNALHVMLQAQEDPVVARYTGPLDMPCLDSCLEFFFCPIAEDGRYFNVEFNPNGCLYLGFGHDRYDSVRLLPPEGTIVPKPEYIDGGWRISYDIPVSFIQIFVPEFKPVSGGKMRANFYKCGDKTVKIHYLSAFPIDIPKPDFHRPEWFQEISFE